MTFLLLIILIWTAFVLGGYALARYVVLRDDRPKDSWVNLGLGWNKAFEYWLKPWRIFNDR
jgi:hypothetical protein